MIAALYAWLIASCVSLMFTIFNVFTIVIIVCDGKLIKRPSNYPILSFLAGSALQGFISSPLYIFKKLALSGDAPVWLCDVSRISYIYSGHVLKLSLLVISWDRMFVVKYPFKYALYVTRRSMTAVIVTMWLVTLGIDLVPFYHEHEIKEHCQYIPSRAWGLSVLVSYNILPFFIITLNYVLIWKMAAAFNLSDRQVKNSLTSFSADGNSVTFKSRRKSKLGMFFEMKATKTSLVLILVYMVCWLPLGVFFMIDHFCYNCLSNRPSLSDTKAAIKILAATSSILTPIIYCWWNKEYCDAAMKFCGKRGCAQKRNNFEEFEMKKLVK